MAITAFSASSGLKGGDLITLGIPSVIEGTCCLVNTPCLGTPVKAARWMCSFVPTETWFRPCLSSSNDRGLLVPISRRTRPPRIIYPWSCQGYVGGWIYWQFSVCGFERASLLALGGYIEHLAKRREPDTQESEQDRCKSFVGHDMCFSRLGAREW